MYNVRWYEALWRKHRQSKEAGGLMVGSVIPCWVGSEGLTSEQKPEGRNRKPSGQIFQTMNSKCRGLERRSFLVLEMQKKKSGRNSGKLERDWENNEMNFVYVQSDLYKLFNLPDSRELIIMFPC